MSLSSPAARTLTLACTLALLSGCARMPDPSSSPSPSSAVPPLAVAQVDLRPGESAAEVAARFKAAVLEFHPQDGYAILGRGAAPDGEMSAQSAGGAAFEPNRGQFVNGLSVMHGTRSLWAGGEGRLAPLKVWADGTRSLWAGGVFSPLPGNSDVLRFAGLDTAQERAPRLGAGVTVAVIDTGLDLDHPAFAGALAPRGDWWDFHDGDAVPQEQGPNGPGYGHGTSVASIVLQVAPGARILPLRVLGPGGSGDALNVQRAIDHAVERGAKVINLSLGSVQRSNVVKQAVARAARQNVLVVSSAGNENRQGLTYPAADADQSSAGERSVSVGSVSVTGVKSVFSNFDRNLELTAPGEAVLGAYPENRVAEWSGTSMAAPLASGALALALGQDGALDVRGLTDLLIDSARDVYAHPQNRPYVGQLGERGSLDVARFLERALRPTKPQS